MARWRGGKRGVEKRASPRWKPGSAFQHRRRIAVARRRRAEAESLQLCMAGLATTVEGRVAALKTAEKIPSFPVISGLWG